MTVPVDENNKLYRTMMIDEEQRERMSPSNQKKLSYIEKIQNKLLKETREKPLTDQKPDSKLILAFEAMEYAFAEITTFKHQSMNLA